MSKFSWTKTNKGSIFGDARNPLRIPLRKTDKASISCKAMLQLQSTFAALEWLLKVFRTLKDIQLLLLLICRCIGPWPSLGCPHTPLQRPPQPASRKPEVSLRTIRDAHLPLIEASLIARWKTYFAISEECHDVPQAAKIRRLAFAILSSGTAKCSSKPMSRENINLQRAASGLIPSADRPSFACYRVLNGLVSEDVSNPPSPDHPT